MRKKEKLLYQGEKSKLELFIKDITFFLYCLFKSKVIPIILGAFIFFCCLISILDVFGIFTWNKLFTLVGAVDGVKSVNSNFAVYYLDVGQSDCTIIKCDDEILLIDTGTVNQISTIRKSLYTLEIDKIDYMIVTHQHDDHMSGAEELIKYYDVNNIMMPKLSDINYVDSLTYKNLINAICEYEINPIGLVSGYSFNLGSALVEVLAPIKQDKDLNNMSAVIKITYGDTSFIFQGDSEQKVEKQLINLGYDLSADVIKIGHHGSKTSTYDDYLNEVNPDIAVISCAPDNNFGHPSYSVVDKLEDKDITTYSTSLHGNITISSDGKNITVFTEK